MTPENNIKSVSNAQFHFYKLRQKNCQIPTKSTNLQRRKYTSNQALKNTEYFTNIQNYLTTKCLFVEAQIEYLYKGIDPASLCKILIQNMYLLQISYLFKLNLWISKQYYVQKTKNSSSLNNIQLFGLFCFESELEQLPGDKRFKTAVLQNKFQKFLYPDSNPMENFFYILEKSIQTIEFYFQCLQKNNNPKSSSNSQSQINKNLLFQFKMTYQNVIKPQKQKITQPKLLLKILQQTKIFRCHSTLVKIVNGSLFYSLRLNSPGIVKQLRNTVIELKQFFKFQDQQFKNQRSIIKLIDHFFSNLCRGNIIEITKSLKGINQQNDSESNDLLSLFQYDQETKNTCPTIRGSIMIPEQKYLLINKQALDRLLKNENLTNLQQDKECSTSKSLQFQIAYKYLSNQIKIICITDIDVLVDNMDFLNYLITTFNDGLKSIVYIDTVQKFRKSMTKRIEKVIAFKMECKLKPFQQPLTKILQLIDVGVLADKIFTAQLKKKSFIKLQEYKKREQLCQTYRHYENIFHNIMKKFYSQLQNQTIS